MKTLAAFFLAGSALSFGFYRLTEYLVEVFSSTEDGLIDLDEAEL